MKRPISPTKPDPSKRPCRPAGEDNQAEPEFGRLDENILFEVLKHVDAKTLARCACVSKTWNRTSQDERLWEIICARHWPNIGCGNRQLRSVVLALGGFHSLYLSLSNLKQQQGRRSGWGPLAPMMGGKPLARWGKDEVHLSLSLMSIGCYEKMNSTSSSSGGGSRGRNSLGR
ncbi:hypothetical protein MLD38_034477 [Melastoma candidum]|uniref:Uncharacterized protein n=1 Tax=Melastoma candidum TaxID=119954 RepID=A0ACB9MBZ0_9MYRT|nr:hypothetical protein MLD38_034477 [Melastoma candidum]